MRYIVACCVENAPMIGGLPTIQGAGGGRNLIRAAPAFIPPIARNTLPPNYHIVKYAKHNENAMWCKHIFSPHPQKEYKNAFRCIFLYI